MQENILNDIYLSPGPHFSGKRKSWQIMLMVIIALLPECVMGVVYFGIPALITILVSVASCVLFEALFQKAIKRPLQINDLSAVVTGILLALTLPSTTPIWMTILGACFAIVVTKVFFGGIGCNIWNPALSGRAFLLMSFPVAIGSSWVAPKSDALSTATPLANISNYVNQFASTNECYWNLFIGNHAGSIGETCILAIIISGLFLLVTRIIDWRAPLMMILTCSVCTLLVGKDVLITLLSGGLLFGAFFMVTDYTTSPVTKPGRYLFGFGCGLITFLIREFGGYPEGVMFSILIMNTLVPFLNKLSKRKYGYGLKKQSAKKDGGKA